MQGWHDCRKAEITELEYLAKFCPQEAPGTSSIPECRSATDIMMEASDITGELSLYGSYCDCRAGKEGRTSAFSLYNRFSELMEYCNRLNHL